MLTRLVRATKFFTGKYVFHKDNRELKQNKTRKHFNKKKVRQAEELKNDIKCHS